jgi:DNA-binding transcriptional MerR regulator
MSTQGEFFERPDIILATTTTEETPLPEEIPAPQETAPKAEAPAKNGTPPARKTMKDLSIPKLYYSISEVSRLTGLEPYVLRYWETEFDELRPQKNRAGNRVYSSRDIKFVIRIKELLREKRYTLEGAKAVLKTERHSEAKPPEEPASSDPAQIPLVSDKKPAAPTAFLTLQEIRSMKQSLLDLRAILVK